MSEPHEHNNLANDANTAPGKSRLVRRTFVFALILVSSGLLASGAAELHLRHREIVSSMWVLQREMAESAAFKIQQFIEEIERTMRASTQTPSIVRAGLTDAYEVELIKLLKVTPAIMAASALDLEGLERIKVSRTEMVRAEDLKDRSGDEAFRRTQNDASYFGPVYFVQESEPYARIAVPIKRFTQVVGTLVGEVNLKHIWRVISQIQAGQAGYAYVVSSDGKLIAHPDITMVLQRRNLRDLSQVRAALAGEPGPFAAHANMSGESVFAAYAHISNLDWTVMVERPTAEAYAPLYSSLLRTTLFLLVGLGVALLASLLIGLRVVRPLQVLREGAARIGAGELDHRIDVRTGDELETLADEFNQTTAKLQESYANIERVSQLKRFFSPQLAEQIVSSGGVTLTQSHRREITVVFCDLRNFTGFSSAVEPDEAMRVLQEFYPVIGALLHRFEATVEHFAGDGLMAFFNDPIPCRDPEQRAVRMALMMQNEVGELVEQWNQRGFELGFGIGIASGFATLGHIGSEEQFHYAAIGSVSNLASRLCDQARSGQTLITEEIYAAVADIAEVERIGELSFKGFPDPVCVLNVVGIRDLRH